jgi:amidase
MTAPVEFTATEAAGLLSSGSLTAVGLAEFYLDRIERLNPEFNAVIAVDRSGATEAARASDERRAAGASIGGLDGVPVLIKDNIEAVGLPGTAGSRALLGSPPAADAPVVSNLRNAGLVLLGSTNLSEWANFRSTRSVSGWSAVGDQTRNPYDTTRNTSGSSSGSAASIAAGLAPLAVGTETDGSIVSPAGLCGMVGFRPTLGRIPGAGIVPLSSRQDTAGPMSRTVADAVLLLNALSGHAFSADPISLAGVRVAVWRPHGMTAEITAVFDEVVRLLTDAGCSLHEAKARAGGPFENAEFDALVAEFAAELPAYLAARPGNHPKTFDELLAFDRADGVELSRFSDEIFELCTKAPGLDSDAYRKARGDATTAAEQGLSGLLNRADLAIAPTNAPAWPIDYGQAEDHGLLTSSLSAVTGSPSVSLPAGTARNLPLGVSVLGRIGEDERVLAFAAALEALLPAPVRAQ